MSNNYHDETKPDIKDSLDNDMPTPGMEDDDIFSNPNGIMADIKDTFKESEKPFLPKPIQNEFIEIDEEMIIPDNNSNSKDDKEEKTLPKKNNEMSSLLNTEDFELVIKKDKINLNNLKDEDIKFETLNIPNNTNSEMIAFVEGSDNGDSTINNVSKDLDNRPYVAKLLEEAKVREQRGAHERDDNSNYFSAATFNKGDKTVKMHPSFINARKKDATSSSMILEKINKSTNTDVVISIPLYNSGIWLGIQSPSEPEIIQLQMLALENEMKLGASSAGLVYSNYSVLFRKYALDLAFSNIAYSSVQVENFSMLRELIDVTDENTIINGLNAAIYPTGVDRMITCSNFLREKNPCNHSVQAKLHFDRLHYPDYSRLSDDLLLHMAKKTPNSTTIAEVEEYKRQLSIYTESIKEYKLPNGETITISYKIPNIKNGIMQGEYWTEKINMLVNDIITGTNKNVAEIPNEMMKIYIDSAMRTNLLGLYLHFIKSIKIDDQEETDYRQINNILQSLTKVDNITSSIISDIINLIKNASITTIGHTQYTCPTCKTVNDNDTVEHKHSFKKIIPFNVLGVLFILGSLKYSTVILRKE